MSDPTSAGHLPPGWPTPVRPPGTPEWERTATAWMFDLCPPDYRAYDVLRRHPLVLARFAHHHLQAAIAGALDGLGAARHDLADLADPALVEAAIAAYEREGARLLATARALALVERALRGRRYVPRL